MPRTAYRALTALLPRTRDADQRADGEPDGGSDAALRSPIGRGRNLRSRWSLVLLVPIVLLLAVPSRAAPDCFGARSRDPLKPCVNRELDSMVVPSPEEALL